jgi:hypothetical protein
MRGERREVRAVDLTFPDDEKNAAVWKRWMGYLKLDMWVVFFGGAMIGMFLPIILMRQMVLLTGEKPTQANVPTFVANALDQEYGRWLFYIALFIGFLILFDTQLGIFEALVRNMTDAVNTSPRLQQAINGDPRRFYYPFMIVLTAVIGLFLQFFQPATLVLISANMSNFGRPHLPVPAHLPELEASQDGPAQDLDLRGPAAELRVLQLLLHQLRVRPAHRGGAHPVLSG